VKDYSRLMGDDDVATVEALTAYQEAMTKLISQHRGRVVDSPGDNLLAEFSSVVAAVQCSVSIQEELTARNADLSVDRRMEFSLTKDRDRAEGDPDRGGGGSASVIAREESDPPTFLWRGWPARG